MKHIAKAIAMLAAAFLFVLALGAYFDDAASVHETEGSP